MSKEKENFRSGSANKERGGADTSVSRRTPRIRDWAGWLERVNVPGAVPSHLPKELFPFGKEDELIEQGHFNIEKEEASEERGGEYSQKTDDYKSHGFEPFVGKEPQDSREDNLFVNIYGGNYSQRMKLNRKGVERALEIAHLEGKVFLTSFSEPRSRPEAQGNELAARRFLIYDNKKQRAEEENPYKRVLSVPEGWRIEVNDQRITEDLMEKKLAGETLQKAFVREFNKFVKEGIRESVWREKFSSEKDPRFRQKFFISILYGHFPAVLFAPLAISDPPFYATAALGLPALQFAVVNSLSRANFGRIHIDNSLEVFMPPVEIDKVARTYAYLVGKGRRLAREAKE